MYQRWSWIVAFILLVLHSSNSTVFPLTGDGWTINNNESYFAHGHIPGTIHTILRATNQIPEPYRDYNDVDLRHLIYTPWIFRKSFSLTDDFLASTQFTLHFDQIDTVTNITLNQCFIGQTNSMFIAYIFNVARSCLRSTNELWIYFESPVIYALTQAQAYNVSVPPDCPPDIQYGECHVQFIRKEPCSFSWDWMTTNSTAKSIQLESVNVASYESSTDRWQVDVLLSSLSDPFTSEFRFMLKNASFSFQTNITFNHNVSVLLSIPNEMIQIWWPNGYGDQALYILSVYCQEQLVGSRSIGFRTVELVQQGYGPNINGTSFYFRINGHPIFIKGSNWIPPDAFQERVTDERLERLLVSAQLAHINMLHIWGGGIYERDSFYEIADRLGIMLWHDFMFACSLYPVDQPFLNNVRKEVLYQVKRLQSHPSLVLWSGNNENELAIAQNWYRLPTEKIAKAKDDYRKLYVDTVMQAVKEVDKGNNRPFVTSSPSNGVESVREDYIATNPQDPLYGDVHFYGFNNDTWNPTTYPITRFLSETGMNSLPSLDSWRQVTNNITDLQYQSHFFEHRKHDLKVNNLPGQIKSNLPIPLTNDTLKNFTQMIYLTQINQAMTLKSISDWCRIHSSVDMIDPKTSQGNTMGLMYWQIGDIWQAPTSSTIEYELKWKMSHYYVQQMYEPVYALTILIPYLANVTDETARISVYVINELLNGTNVYLNCSFHSSDRFSARASFAFNVSFDGPAVRHITDLPYSIVMKNAGCSNSSQCLLHCHLNNSKKVFEQTLFLTQPKNYPLDQPNLRIKTIEKITPTDVSITITAIRPALFVWLDVPLNVTGYFSANGFHMFEPLRIVIFHSWTPIENYDIRITSLFDVTQP